MWDQCHEQGESVDSRDKADHRCVFGMKGLTVYQREIEEKLDE